MTVPCHHVRLHGDGYDVLAPDGHTVVYRFEFDPADRREKNRADSLAERFADRANRTGAQ